MRVMRCIRSDVLDGSGPVGGGPEGVPGAKEGPGIGGDEGDPAAKDGLGDRDLDRGASPSCPSIL